MPDYIRLDTPPTWCIQYSTCSACDIDLETDGDGWLCPGCGTSWSMFWLYYPDCRDYFGRFQAFNEGNDASVMSWEDLFEIRLFSSYIFKVTNVYNRRLQDYLSGTNLLLEGEKIKAEIFNFENDLWQY